jgi:ribosomal protein S18 acetylase RimI-like enzyme
MESITRIVRVAEPADAAAVSELRCAAFAALRGIYRPVAAAAVCPPEPRPTRTLIAESAETIIGAVTCRAETDRLHLIGLAVDSGWRRRGVARQLISAAEALAREAGLPRLTLYTIRQTGNVAIFERLGFRPLAEEPARNIKSATGQPLIDVFMERTRGVAGL